MKTCDHDQEHHRRQQERLVHLHVLEQAPLTSWPRECSSQNAARRGPGAPRRVVAVEERLTGRPRHPLLLPQQPCLSPPVPTRAPICRNRRPPLPATLRKESRRSGREAAPRGSFLRSTAASPPARLRDGHEWSRRHARNRQHRPSIEYSRSRWSSFTPRACSRAASPSRRRTRCDTIIDT